jgi:hypothetical protein
MPEKVAREMEEVRIRHLDVLEPDSYHYLTRRAALINRLLAEVLELGRRGDGAAEKSLYENFPAHQQEEIRNVIFQAQRRGWLKRENVGGRYFLQTAPAAPSVHSDDT